MRKIDVTATLFLLVQNIQQTHDGTLIGSGAKSDIAIFAERVISNYAYSNYKIELTRTGGGRMTTSPSTRQISSNLRPNSFPTFFSSTGAPPSTESLPFAPWLTRRNTFWSRILLFTFRTKLWKQFQTKISFLNLLSIY